MLDQQESQPTRRRRVLRATWRGILHTIKAGLNVRNLTHQSSQLKSMPERLRPTLQTLRASQTATGRLGYLWAWASIGLGYCLGAGIIGLGALNIINSISLFNSIYLLLAVVTGLFFIAMSHINFRLMTRRFTGRERLFKPFEAAVRKGLSVQDTSQDNHTLTLEDLSDGKDT